MISDNHQPLVHPCSSSSDNPSIGLVVITHNSSSVHPPFQPTQPAPRGTKKSADRRWVRSTMRFLMVLGAGKSRPLFHDWLSKIDLPIKKKVIFHIYIYSLVIFYVYQRVHEFLWKSRLETSNCDQLWLAKKVLQYVAICSPYSVMGPCNDSCWAPKEWDSTSL